MMKMKQKILTLLAASLIFFVGCKDDELSFEEQLAADLSAIDAYLEANQIETLIHESDIRYIELTEGTGNSPEIGDKIAVKYQAQVLNGGRVLDAEYGETLTLASNFISAWQFMVPEMKEGGSLIMYAPSGYCFGRSGNAFVPANANMRWDIELMGIVNTVEDQFTMDTTILENYLTSNGLSAQVHESGIRYIIDQEGTGASPEATDRVKVKYSGYFLSGNIFDEALVGVTFRVSDLIESWVIMIPEMKVGEKRTILAPSSLCYGPSGNLSIPPDTNLIFEIELEEIE